MYSGRLTNSATHSAVSVLPTPGGPCNTHTSPRPLPLMMSSKVSRFCECVVTSACTVFLTAGSSTSSSKQLVFHSMSVRLSMKNSRNFFSAKEYPRTVAVASMASSSDSAGNCGAPSAETKTRLPAARLRLRSSLADSPMLTGVKPSGVSRRR